MQLVEIFQYMWSTGEILRELGCNILDLIPKGSTDTWGISLLETLWKFMETIINTRLQSSIHFHDVLQMFHTGRYTETATMDIKLAQ